VELETGHYGRRLLIPPMPEAAIAEAAKDALCRGQKDRKEYG
jgi:hypothetical protein